MDEAADCDCKTLDEKIKIGSHGAFPLPAAETSFSIETFCARGYTPTEKNTGAVAMPIFLSSTFAHPEFGVSTGFDYGRCLNPTRLELIGRSRFWSIALIRLRFRLEWRQFPA